MLEPADRSCAHNSVALRDAIQSQHSPHMMLNRWHLPDAPLRARVIAITMSGLIGVIALAWAARAGLHLGVSYPIKAGIVFTAVLMLAAGFLRGYHPYAQLGPANRITTARAMLMALVIGLVGEPVSAAGAVAAASMTAAGLDGVDGWLARRSRMASEFGARFDMEIDALLIMALAILAWQYGKAGSWVVASGL